MKQTYAVLGIFTLSVGLFQWLIKKGNYFISDASIYLCHANRILEGDIPYRDFIHANLPLTPYVSAMYRFIAFGNQELYFTLASIFGGGVAILIAYITNTYVNNRWFALIAGTMFLLSNGGFFVTSAPFLVLPGIALMLIAMVLLRRSQFILAGLVAGVAVCIKVYLAVYLIPLLIIGFQKSKKGVLTLVGVWSVLVCAITGFFWWLSGDAFIQQVFENNISRIGSADSNAKLYYSFAINHFIIIIAMIYAAVRVRHYPEIGGSALCFFVLLIVLFFSDTYPVYLITFLPIGCIALGLMVGDLSKRVPQEAVYTLCGIAVTISILFGFSSYIESRSLGAVKKQEISRIIRDTQPNYLYGEYGLVNHISHTTGLPVTNGHCDLQRQFFLKGLLDREAITSKVISERTLVLVSGYNPQNSLDAFINEDSISIEILDQSCSLKEILPYRLFDANALFIFLCEGEDLM